MILNVSLSMSARKYWTIIKTEFQRQFTYRSDIVTYAVGNFFGLLTQVVIWTIIFKSQSVVRGYTYPEMMTYVVIGWIFMFITSNYNFEHNVAHDIHYGRLTGFLAKPISYLKYKATISVGRIIVAFAVIIVESAIYIMLFNSHLLFEMSLSKAFIIFIMLILSFVIKLFFALIIGLFSFWLVYVTGLETFLNILFDFLSGVFFPISILPPIFLKISLFLPFAYTLFAPTQYYLGKMNTNDAISGIGIQIIWIFILYFIIKIIWKKGLKKYEGYGA